MAIKFIVEEKERLDAAVRTAMALSVQRAKAWIKTQGVLVNGHLVKKPAFMLRSGDRVETERPPIEEKRFAPKTAKWTPKILYEDEWIIAANKPSGVISVPTSHSHEKSLQDRL